MEYSPCLCGTMLQGNIGRSRGKSGLDSFEVETALIIWILKMQRLGHSIRLSQCHLKVVEITQDHTRLSQRAFLDQGGQNSSKLAILTWHLEWCIVCWTAGWRVYALRIFHLLNVNLQDMYYRHNYPYTHIWNCDKSGAQIRQNGSAHVLARRGI